MKKAALVAILIIISASIFQFSTRPAWADSCNSQEWTYCQSACPRYTPGSCYLISISCENPGGSSPTCICEIICSPSSHPGGDPGGVKHLVVVPDFIP
jgi:hypothetical protein